MSIWRCLSLFLIAVFFGAAAAEEPGLLPLTGDLDVHDPALAKEGATYYLFCTGGFRRGGILPIYTSPDLQKWQRFDSALIKLPEWASEEFPRTRSAWAPDISYFNGKYHLYYALSKYGTNDSAIALLTNAKLDPSSKEYKWVDEGLVVRSRPGRDDFNAIDPNIAVEDEANIWLSWGSFWGGIILQRIDPRTGRLEEGSKLHRLAARPRKVDGKVQTSGGAIEAPFLIHHGDFWYLFVSWDYCCRGNRSDYKVVVGRSASITGPYLDRKGKAMIEGGGTLVIEAATDQWRGAGHPAVYTEQNVDYLVFHAYSAETGRPRLQISTVTWDDGWPRVAKLP
jgi:arabinan endo-1,5-alpha-L-arabinosidase